MKMTLTGENSFSLRAELDMQVSRFLSDYGDMALERLDGEEASFEQLQESLQSLPFLSAKKMVVLRTPGSNKQFAENAERLLAELPESTDVIFIEPKLDKRLSYYKLLKKVTDFHEFSALDRNGLAGWLVSVSREQGGQLKLDDARYLVDRVGANQLLLGGELNKLILYDPHISRDNINLLTEPTPQSSIFDLIEAAFTGNTKHALTMYEEQRAMKVEVPQIIAMLAWQLHILAILKSAGSRSVDQIAREAKVNPYVLRKSQAITNRLTLAELKRLVAELLKIDARLKRESIDPDEALKNYLFSLAKN